MVPKLTKTMLVGVLAVLLFRADAVPQLDPPPLDHFQCYKPKTTKGAVKFAPLAGVTITDGFGSLTLDVKKPAALCNPVNKNGEDPTAPSHTEHLEAYKIKTSSGTAKFLPVLNQKIFNQLGPLDLDVIKPVTLMVPSAKSLTSPPPALTDPATDHFTCYKVKGSKGKPKFVPYTGFTLEDQFGSSTVIIKKVTHLCSPTNKLNESPGAEAHNQLLVCYQVKAQSGSPRFQRVTPVYLHNQFGSETLDAVKAQEICVPSFLNAVPTPTATVSETPTPSRTPTPTLTASPTATESPTPTLSPTSTATPTDTNEPTVSPTPTPTLSPTPTVTETPLVTPTPTVTNTPTRTVTPTLTRTPTPVKTPTPTVTVTITVTPTRTRTPTPTPTVTPINRQCFIGGGSASQLGFQVKDTPLGNIRLVTNITGTQTLSFGQQQGGTRAITVPASSIHFDPIVLTVPIVNSQIKICLFPTGPDGTGVTDCVGGTANINYTIRRDHNTNNPPGSNGGLPQDPDCNDTRLEPDGVTVSSACLENSVGGCATFHPGVCNSPYDYPQTGTFGSGSLRITEYLQVRLVNDNGPDGQQCTSDDNYGGSFDVRAYLTTGTARGTVYDTNNSSDSLLDQQGNGCSNCQTQVNGVSKSCNSMVNGSGLNGMTMAAALVALDVDSTAGDAAVTVTATCQ